ncbi:MAG TPA: hypothetical protein PK852_02550 [Mesotoga prima]|uniref:hypothetical protein n=1 Tax=Mesotoga prima TaxID=1184387 RepID=UPI002B6B7F96|nr:hypothetical protein [Mesotoga prima]HPE52975.1 hypothetical protein [Mesotoga prima]
MPKRKIARQDYFSLEHVNDGETEAIQITIGDKWDGKSLAKLWCEGRDYDPDVESYRPVYAYAIATPKWSYNGNDIRGAVNELPNLLKALQSFIAFLLACAEAENEDSENYALFPIQVKEWADHYEDELQDLYALVKKQDNK